MTDPREHPLLMRPELVRATLGGTKTQTRRLMTPANSTIDGERSAAKLWPTLIMERAGQGWVGEQQMLVVPTTTGRVVHIYPRVRPGDRLWVREAWCVDGAWDRTPPGQIPGTVCEPRCSGLPVGYRADDENESRLRGRWRPGIHMPRWACRLVLPVEAVRAERVASISEADALAEGMGSQITDLQALGHLRGSDAVRAVGTMLDTARARFRSTWEQINGKRPGAEWAANPWVWIYQWPPAGPKP